MGFCEDIMVFENDDNDAMYDKMVNYAESIIADLFGQRFFRNNPNPDCITSMVGRYYEIKTGMEDGALEESPDKDLVAGAVVGKEFCCDAE